jgi:hypothetical protein
MRGPLLLVASAGAIIAAPAHARPTGFWPEHDTPVGVERRADVAQGQFLRQREENSDPSRFQPLTPLLPGPYGTTLPPVMLGRTKVGPMTTDDLHLVSDGQGGFRGARPGYRFTIDRDGSVHFDDRRSVNLAAVALLGAMGLFDLTDMVMRARGKDPYAYDKGRVLELTAKLRAPMPEADRRRRIADALARLPQDLESLWRREELAPTERRRLLFELWDELLEGAGAEADAAARARSEIRRFVHDRLPAGSPHAYAPEELRRLNAGRRSRVAFEPY